MSKIIVAATSLSDMINAFSFGLTVNEMLSKILTPSTLFETPSTRNISLPISRNVSKLIYGYLRDEGWISSSVILSSCFLRDVACFDFDALAEKRAIKSCSSLICSSFLALACDCKRCASSDDCFQKS